MPPLRVLDAIIDPARAKELINPEFVANGLFLVAENERGKIGMRYDALPAAAAAEPTAFGCILTEDQGHGGRTTLIAMLWDGRTTVLHTVSPSVDGRTSTVAGRGQAASLSPKAPAQAAAA